MVQEHNVDANPGIEPELPDALYQIILGLSQQANAALDANRPLDAVDPLKQALDLLPAPRCPVRKDAELPASNFYPFFLQGQVHRPNGIDWHRAREFVAYLFAQAAQGVLIRLDAGGFGCVQLVEGVGDGTTALIPHECPLADSAIRRRRSNGGMHSLCI